MFPFVGGLLIGGGFAGLLCWLAGYRQGQEDAEHRIRLARRLERGER